MILFHGFRAFHGVVVNENSENSPSKLIYRTAKENEKRNEKKMAKTTDTRIHH